MSHARSPRIRYDAASQVLEMLTDLHAVARAEERAAANAAEADLWFAVGHLLTHLDVVVMERQDAARAQLNTEA